MARRTPERRGHTCQNRNELDNRVQERKKHATIGIAGSAVASRFIERVPNFSKKIAITSS